MVPQDTNLFEPVAQTLRQVDVSEAVLLADLADAAYMLGRLGGREGIGANSAALLRAEIVAASTALAERWRAEDPS